MHAVTSSCKKSTEIHRVGTILGSKIRLQRDDISPYGGEWSGKVCIHVEHPILAAENCACSQECWGARGVPSSGLAKARKQCHEWHPFMELPFTIEHRNITTTWPVYERRTHDDCAHLRRQENYKEHSTFLGKTYKFDEKRYR